MSSPSQNVLKSNLKSPGFVQSGANLTHFGAKSNISVVQSVAFTVFACGEMAAYVVFDAVGKTATDWMSDPFRITNSTWSDITNSR